MKRRYVTRTTLLRAYNDITNVYSYERHNKNTKRDYDKITIWSKQVDTIVHVNVFEYNHATNTLEFYNSRWFKVYNPLKSEMLTLLFLIR